jgi:hypothetical protein
MAQELIEFRKGTSKLTQEVQQALAEKDELSI